MHVAKMILAKTEVRLVQIYKPRAHAMLELDAQIVMTLSGFTILQDIMSVMKLDTDRCMSANELASIFIESSSLIKCYTTLGTFAETQLKII